MDLGEDQEGSSIPRNLLEARGRPPIHPAMSTRGTPLQFVAVRAAYCTSHKFSLVAATNFGERGPPGLVTSPNEVVILLGTDLFGYSLSPVTCRAVALVDYHVLGSPSKHVIMHATARKTFLAMNPF